MRAATTDRERNLNMVFTTAIEGGINYWAEVLTYHWHVSPSDFTEAADFSAEIRDMEDGGKFFTIDAKVIARGIRRAYDYMREHSDGYGEYQRLAIRDLQFSRWDDVDYDATTADIVVQFGLFGELVYG